jgi:hypothetical protein
VGTGAISVAGTPGTNTLTISESGSVATTYAEDSGTATPIAGVLNINGAQNITTAGAGNTVSIAVSGTTNNAVQIGNSTGSLTSIALGTTGQVLTGVTGSAPTFQTPASTSISITGDTGGPLVGTAFTFTGGTTGLAFNGAGTTETLGGTLVVANGGTGAATLTANSVLLGNGTSAVSALGAATNGQLIIGSTGVSPVLAAITAGAGLSVTNSAGSITIAATGAQTWTDVTGTSAAMAIDNGYVSDNAGLVTLTLPASPVLGSMIRVTGKGAGGWKIAQNAGQLINFGVSTTTTGTGGSLASTNTFDSVTLVCITATTTFNVIASVGNITVV